MTKSELQTQLPQFRNAAVVALAKFMAVSRIIEAMEMNEGLDPNESLFSNVSDWATDTDLVFLYAGDISGEVSEMLPEFIDLGQKVQLAI